MPSEHAAAADLALDRANALLLIVDVQERLCTAMPPGPLAALEKNARVLIRAARRLDIPVVATEQYPKGLGPTVASLKELLPADPMTKMEFSCGASKEIARRILGAGRKQVIVAGMEAHVCVFQTVRDLLRGGFSVFIAQDAILSRTEANRSVGLGLCEKAGAVLSSTETILFDLLGVAGTPEFKELTALIK
jgi:nicotinamidase-related amidase